MKKTSYLDRFRLAARWMLPPGEADEVVADYTDLLEGDQRTDEALCRDFGRPWKAAEMLCQPKQYRNWLILFCLMAGCLLLPLCAVFFHWYNTYGIPDLFLNQYMILGAAFLLALLGYRRFGAEKQRLTPAFPVLAVLLLLLGICVVSLTVAIFHPAFLQWLAQLEVSKSWHLGEYIGVFLELAALFSALSGLWALVQARVRDRRWRALFLLALTVLLAALNLLRILKNMTFDVNGNYIWFARYTVEITALSVLGLAGSGVLLC